MPKVGTLGLDMMFRTCTVQVNAISVLFAEQIVFLIVRYFTLLTYSSPLMKLSAVQLLPLQVNLDFDSEADMIRKFRAGLALQPVRNP